MPDQPSIVVITPKLAATSKGAQLVREAYAELRRNPETRELSAREEERGGVERWLERLKAGDHPKAGAPVFHLAVAVDRAGAVEGLATADYHITGPRGGQFADAGYHLATDPANASQIEDQLRTALLRALRETANRVGDGKLRGIVEEVTHKGLFGGQWLDLRSGQGQDAQGKHDSTRPIGVQVTMIGDPNDDAHVKALVTSHVHAQHLFHTGETISQADSKEALTPEVIGKLNALVRMEPVATQVGRLGADRLAPIGRSGGSGGR